MEQTLNHGMCRCCASEGMFKNFSATYQWMGADEVYADMLKECFDISLTTADDWNNGGICEVCITQLRNASNFRKQVLQTEDQFKKALQDKLYKDSIVKVEVNRDEDDLDSDNNVSDFSGTGELEFEVPVKEELEETKIKKRTAKATTSRAKKAKTEDGEPSSKRVLRNKVKISKQESKPSRLLKRKPVPKGESLSASVEMKETRELEKHRYNIRQILQCSNATPIRCRGGIGYACCFCTSQFPDPADLKKHTLEFHDEKSKRFFMQGKMMFSYLVKLDITALECKICNSTIDTVEQIIDHLKIVHKKSMFTDIKNHIMSFKFTEVCDVLRCVICPSVFNKFKALQEHMNTHYRNHVCDVCNAGFVNKSNLLAHADIHKTGTFNCDFCTKVYTSFRRKKSHEKSVHTHVNMLNKCGYCKEMFKDYRLKEKHLQVVHGVGPMALKCQACDKSFTSKTALTVHTKRDHLMERRHECNECDMKFFVPHELKEHMVRHTGVRKFECEVCHKAYGRRKTLREHMRIHDDDRRFKCEHCGMAFLQKCTWRGHLRSKHGVKV